MFLLAFGVVAVGRGGCQLEEHGFCDFKAGHCHFNQSNLRDADQSLSFSQFVNKPLRSNVLNKDCGPLPDSSRPFTVSIEPCFTDYATRVSQTASECPDLPPEYYKLNGRMVETLIDLPEPDKTTVPADLSMDSYISGDPVEFHILTIGRHFLWGTPPHEWTPNTGASDITFGLSPKDFKFRTLPLNKHDYSILNQGLGVQTMPNGNQCPIEIQFADDRTVHQDLKQQYENIYVLSNEYYADLGNNAIRHGRGCYMCYKMNGTTDTEAIKQHPSDWLGQYDAACTLEAREYAASYVASGDEYPAQFQDINEIEFVRDVVAGVYTLYPSVTLPPALTDPEAIRSLVDKQLRYIMDPEYHITVEIVGMKKSFSSTVFRNLHGRMLEKNMVDFDPKKKSLYGKSMKNYEGESAWYDVNSNVNDSLVFLTGEENRHIYYPKPNKCLTSFAEYSEGQPGLKTFDDVTVCYTTIDEVKVKENLQDPVSISIKGDMTQIKETRSINLEGDDSSSIRQQAINSLKLAFDNDYCFFKPAKMKITWLSETVCRVQQGNTLERIGETVEGWFGGYEGYSSVTKIIEDVQEFEICNEADLLAEYHKLKKLPKFQDTQDQGRKYHAEFGADLTPPNQQSDANVIFTDYLTKYIKGLDPTEFPLLTKIYKDLNLFNRADNARYGQQGDSYLAPNNCFSPNDKDHGLLNMGLGGYSFYGYLGPELVTPRSTCPFKPDHGQVRLMPTSIYANSKVSDTPECPPENCHRACVSRFTDEPFFKAFIEKRQTWNGIGVGDLPVPFTSKLLTDDVVNEFVKPDGPYGEFCTYLAEAISNETGKLQSQYIQCEPVKKEHDGGDPSACFNGNSYDASKCDDSEIINIMKAGAMPFQVLQDFKTTFTDYLINFRPSNQYGRLGNLYAMDTQLGYYVWPVYGLEWLGLAATYRSGDIDDSWVGKGGYYGGKNGDDRTTKDYEMKDFEFYTNTGKLAPGRKSLLFNNSELDSFNLGADPDYWKCAPVFGDPILASSQLTFNQHALPKNPTGDGDSSWFGIQDKFTMDIAMVLRQCVLKDGDTKPGKDPQTWRDDANSDLTTLNCPTFPTNPPKLCTCAYMATDAPGCQNVDRFQTYLRMVALEIFFNTRVFTEDMPELNSCSNTEKEANRDAGLTLMNDKNTGICDIVKFRRMFYGKPQTLGPRETPRPSPDSDGINYRDHGFSFNKDQESCILSTITADDIANTAGASSNQEALDDAKKQANGLYGHLCAWYFYLPARNAASFSVENPDRFTPTKQAFSILTDYSDFSCYSGDYQQGQCSTDPQKAYENKIPIGEGMMGDTDYPYNITKDFHVVNMAQQLVGTYPISFEGLLDSSASSSKVFMNVLPAYKDMTPEQYRDECPGSNCYGDPSTIRKDPYARKIGWFKSSFSTGSGDTEDRTSTSICFQSNLWPLEIKNSFGRECEKYEKAAWWAFIKQICTNEVVSVERMANSNCNNFLYTRDFYGNNFDEYTYAEQATATWSNIGAMTPNYIGFGGDIDRIVAESNIIGVTVTEPAFSGTAPDQFPGGIIVNSTHPNIHTRIQRTMDGTSSALSDINCNVATVRTPGVAFHRVEFDNTGCQESALNLVATELLKVGEDLADNVTKVAFENFKGWNFAALRVTKGLANTDPKNFTMVDVKFTSSVAFRKTFPGRPLVSVDNEVLKSSYVDVDGMYISDANDTFDYVVDVGAGDAIPLMPLDMIMWNYKGEVNFGYFPEPWEMVSFAEGGKENTAENFYSEASNKLFSFDLCPLKEHPESNERWGNNTNTSYCQEKGSPSCVYQDFGGSGFCIDNIRDTRETLQILDGNDFFDLAADRYRCFDPLTVDCTTAAITEALTIVTVGVIVMVAFHSVFKFANTYQKEECISILESKAEALGDGDLKFKEVED